MPGFASPAILFLNSWDAPERSFCHQVFGALLDRGYTRYVEPCAGAFAMPMVAHDAGWFPSSMEASDTSLYSAIVGGLLAGHDPTDLDVRIDGVPVELPGDPIEDAATLLWAQLLARTQARPDVAYWQTLIFDLVDNRQHHLDSISDRLGGLLDRLRGIDYRRLDMWAHMEQVVNDPHTIVNCNPPTYFKGFERFFDTKGRLTWNEPSYDFFDPEVGVDRMVAMFDGAPALMLCLQQKPPGEACHPRPVFARDLSPGQYVYLISNRPDEVFAITGGPKVGTRKAGTIEPSKLPIIPYDYEVTKDSEVQCLPCSAQVADYYRSLWMHRLVPDPGGQNLLVAIDGRAAGVIGYNAASMTMAYQPTSPWLSHVILRFAVGAPHNELRLTRLMTMLALQKRTMELTASPATALFLNASLGCVTMEYTRHPESKGLRGLMKLVDRKPHPDGHQLIYSAEWRDDENVVGDYLTKEQRWRNNRKSA